MHAVIDNHSGTVVGKLEGDRAITLGFVDLMRDESIQQDRNRGVFFMLREFSERLCCELSMERLWRTHYSKMEMAVTPSESSRCSVACVSSSVGKVYVFVFRRPPLHGSAAITCTEQAGILRIASVGAGLIRDR